MAGKSLDDLGLPLDDLPALDQRDTDWYRFAQEIDDLLATGRYTWAEDSLSGIRETVLKLERVTDGQRRAVGNIEAAVEQRQYRRRYEGHSRRYR